MIINSPIKHINGTNIKAILRRNIDIIADNTVHGVKEMAEIEKALKEEGFKLQQRDHIKEDRAYILFYTKGNKKVFMACED